MTKTLLMGILNATPDSFFDKSRVANVDAAIAKGLQMEREGADILDIGGESTRPGASPVDEKEERSRVLPVIKTLREITSIPISIDTTKPQIAKEALHAGATLINDVTGFANETMVKLAADHACDVCIMHMQGTPRTMQLNPQYEEGVTTHLLHWFEKKTKALMDQGILREKIILDPGIGFGKTVAHNLEIIQNLRLFRGLGFRVLLGMSRKSFLAKIVNRETQHLLPATIAINSVAIEAGVDIIRVHDVAEHRSVIDLMQMYLKERAVPP